MQLDFQLILTIYIGTVFATIIFYALVDAFLFYILNFILYRKCNLLHFPRIYISIYKMKSRVCGPIERNRLGWVRWNFEWNDDENKILDHICEGSKFMEYLKRFILFMWWSKLTVVTVIVSCVVYLYIKKIKPLSLIDTSLLEVYYQNIIYTVKRYLYQFLIMLPSIFLIIPIFLSRYYNSLRGKFKAAIKRNNEKRLDEIIEIHRRIKKDLNNILLKGSRNIYSMLRKFGHDQYYLYVIKERILRISTYILDVENNEIVWKDRDSFVFKDFFLDEDRYILQNFEDITEEVHNINNVLQEADNKHIYHDLFKIWLLDNGANLGILRDIKNIEFLNRIFFTKSYVKKMLDVSELIEEYKGIQENLPSTEKINSLNKDIIEYRDNYLESVQTSLKIGLEKMVDLYSYIRILDKYFLLRNNKMSENIRYSIVHDK